MIVLHVGTNNFNHTPDQVCEGILEIVHTIREKHPSVYIVLPVSKTLYLQIPLKIYVVTFTTYILNFILESSSKRSISKCIEREK